MNDAGRIGFVIRGDYDSTSTYDFLDVVYYNGSSYVAKKNTIGNEPNRDNDFWHIFAEGADEGDYVLKSDYATIEKAGIVKPDGTTITVSEDGTITGSNQTVIDAELSKDSENPVQNKVIAGEIESILSNKQDLLSKRHANSVSNDLNLIKESGIYVIGSTSEYINLPPELSSEAYCALVVFNSGIYIVQEIFMPFDTKGNIYYRFRTEREDGWKSWKTFGEIYDGYDETRKGFAADATQLNKEVEGSYAAGVAEEISGINANLTQSFSNIPYLYNYFTAKQPLFLISESSQDTMYCNDRGCRRNSSAKALIFKKGASLKGVSKTSGYCIISYSAEDAGCTALTNYGSVSISNKRTPKGNNVSLGIMNYAWVSTGGTEDFPVVAMINGEEHTLESRAIYTSDAESYVFILSMADLYLFS